MYLAEIINIMIDAINPDIPFSVVMKILELNNDEILDFIKNNNLLLKYLETNKIIWIHLYISCNCLFKTDEHTAILSSLIRTKILNTI